MKRANSERDLLYAIKHFQIVDRDSLSPNGYNPNRVSEDNLKLLTKSIMANGFTVPIVCRKDRTIIDGFHRYLVSGREPLKKLLGGKVPIVIVEHETHGDDQIATVAYNRARGQHMLEPMKQIVQDLMAEGKSVKEISSRLQMKPEEVFRLSDFTRDDFLKIMIDGAATYNRAYVNQNIK